MKKERTALGKISVSYAGRTFEDIQAENPGKSLDEIIEIHKRKQVEVMKAGRKVADDSVLATVSTKVPDRTSMPSASSVVDDAAAVIAEHTPVTPIASATISSTAASSTASVGPGIRIPRTSRPCRTWCIRSSKWC